MDLSISFVNNNIHFFKLTFLHSLRKVQQSSYLKRNGAWHRLFYSQGVQCELITISEIVEPLLFPGNLLVHGNNGDFGYLRKCAIEWES